jgi:aminoglycoside phosphotransferase (APT) family kinase protein
MNPDPHALPTQALSDYLQAQSPELGSLQSASKFKGGQSNPTYLLQTDRGRYVLRRKPEGSLLASAHAVDREYRVLAALQQSAVPVARPLLLCRDDSVIGSMFYLMEYVEGVVHWDPALPTLEPPQRTALYHQAIDTLAAIHQVDLQAHGLVDYGKPGNYFERQLRRWTEQYRASETQAMPAMEHLISWLGTHCPADDGRVALVHGDFRFDNLMFADDHSRVRAVMDWELSTLGHPHADLGYLCMALRLPRNPVLSGLAGMDREVLGIPSEQAIIDRYADATGAAPQQNWAFHLAFNFFRLAAIAQGVFKRAQQGNASSEHARAAGAMAIQVAELGAACT